MKYFILTIILSLVFLSIISTAQAQVNPVAQAVLFFNPDCEHCRQVMYNDLPPIQKKIGSQLDGYQSNPYPNPEQYPVPVTTISETTSLNGTSIWQRYATNFKKDVTANSLAVTVLIGMVISLLAVLIILIRCIVSDNPQPNIVKIPAWVILLLLSSALVLPHICLSLKLGRSLLCVDR